MSETILFGGKGLLFQISEMGSNFTFFLVGSLFMLALYHVILVLSRSEHLHILNLAFFCIAVGVGLFFSGTEGIKIRLFSSLTAMLFFARFIRQNIPQGRQRSTLRIVHIIYLAEIPLLLFLPINIYIYFFETARGLFIIFLLIIFTRMLNSIIKNQRKNPFLLTTGIGFLLSSYIIDFGTSLLFSPNSILYAISSIGILFFCFSKTISVAIEHSAALKAAEKANIILEQRVQERTQKLEEANCLLYRSATTDPLTGLNNRTILSKIVCEENDRFRRYFYNKEFDYSVLYIDLDNFKYFNDNFGHPVGDLILKEFSTLLLSMLRTSDTAFRIGGDEFLVILPGTPVKGAIQFSKRLIENMKKKNHFEKNIGQYLEMPVEIHEKYRLSTSIGIAGHEEHIPFDINNLIRNADIALIGAKRMGKNCFQVYHSNIDRPIEISYP